MCWYISHWFCIRTNRAVSIPRCHILELRLHGMPRGQHRSADSSHMSINLLKDLNISLCSRFMHLLFVMPPLVWCWTHPADAPCLTNLAGQRQQLCTLPALLTKNQPKHGCQRCHRFLMQLWGVLSGFRSQVTAQQLNACAVISLVSLSQ